MTHRGWETCATELFFPYPSLHLSAPNITHVHSHRSPTLPQSMDLGKSLVLVIRYLMCTGWQHYQYIYEVPIWGNALVFEVTTESLSTYMCKNTSQALRHYFPFPSFLLKSPNIHLHNMTNTCQMPFRSSEIHSPFGRERRLEVPLHRSPSHLCPANPVFAAHQITSLLWSLPSFSSKLNFNFL